MAGPVIASAVILKKHIPGLKDSKKLSPPQRNKLSALIIQNSFYSIGSASEQEIDEINILQASLLAMKRAILNLSVEPGKVLIDGTHKPDLNVDTQTIIGGDSLIDEISAASIVAKVYRDNLMIEFDKQYPKYGFLSHKGYGTSTLRKKGAEAHAVAFVAGYIKELGYKRILTQTDGEPAIVSLMESVAASLPEVEFVPQLPAI